MDLRSAVLALLLFGALGSGLALAEDDPETVVQAREVIEKIDQHRKARNVEALAESYERLVELHNGIEDDKLRKKLQEVVGRVLKDKKLQAAHSQALDTLENLDDPDGVFKQLKPVLPASKDEDVTPDGIQALAIVGAHAPPTGVKTLLGLAEKAKSPKAGAAAVRALGGYGEDEKNRVKILDALVKLALRLGPPADRPLAEADRKRWDVWSPAFVAAANRLTDRELETADAWIALHREHKRRLEALFPE